MAGETLDGLALAPFAVTEIWRIVRIAAVAALPAAAWTNDAEKPFAGMTLTAPRKTTSSAALVTIAPEFTAKTGITVHVTS